MVGVMQTPFDNDRIHLFVTRLLGKTATEDARRAPNMWEFELEERQVLIVTDESADRMRVMVPIADLEGLPPGIERRMLQANFDAVLDARYAIAQGVVWSVFIHPLGSLTNDDLRSGVAQVVTAAATFGSSFTSGALVFGGGDSSDLHEALYQRIFTQAGALDEDH